MRLLLLLCALLGAPAIPSARGAVAQDAASVTVELRITSIVAQGTHVVVDRGRRDGLAVGDAVVFRPRQGGVRRGTVVRVDERSAVIEMRGSQAPPPPGTRGEAQIPRERRAAPDPKPEPAVPVWTGEDEGDSSAGQPEDPDAAPEHPPWANSDSDWRPGMPLLGRVGMVRPEDRPQRTTGRVYFLADGTWTSESGRDDSLLRFGADLVQENPFGEGGTAYLDFELDRFEKNVPDFDGASDGGLRLDRASYAWGGTRYRPDRIEGGRFLQSGLAEFGVLDGVEWSRRRDNGDRYGFSAGLMPEPDADMNTGNDFQIAAWYRWVADATERFSVAGGVQKTWHEGAPDRDLLVLDTHYLPVAADGWDAHATVWIDHYDSGDALKGAGFEVTQAFLNLGRRWEAGHGVDMTARRIRFPELLRNEYLPPTLAEIADDRYDRASVGGWRWTSEERQVHGEVGIWNDQIESGGDVEAGVLLRDLWHDDSDTDLTVYANQGQFAFTLGARLSHSWEVPDGRWLLAYEATNHHLDFFSNDVDDLPGHRAQASRFLDLPSGWTLSFDGDVFTWDQDFAWSFGLQVQKSF